MIKVRVLFFVLCIIHFLEEIKGQANNQNIFDLQTMLPTSPEAAMLGKFGDIPVGYYTGTPNISIPLYSLKESGLEIPIILQYHASGIKVEEQAGYVGLGWSLEPGGMITQIINGKEDAYDFLVSNDPTAYQLLKTGIVNSIYNERPENGISWNCFPNAPGPNDDSHDILGSLLAGDGQPDIYQYYFSGYSGKFFIHPETGQIVLLDKMQEIQFIKVNADLWKAVTLDGHIFWFGIKETSKIETSAFPTGYSWRLTKIQLNNNKEINFEYSQGYYEWFNYKETYHTPFDYNLDPTFYKTFSLKTQHTIYYPKSISSSDLRIEFNLEDRADMVGSADIDGISNNGSLSVKRLKSVDVVQTVNNVKLLTYDFTYDYFNYVTTGGTFSVPVNASNDILGKRLKLVSVQETGHFTTGSPVSKPPYSFQYNEQVLLPKKNSFSRDFWGFFNGKSNSKLLPDLSYFYYTSHPAYDNLPLAELTRIQGADRTTDMSKMKAAMLTRMTYPTGGHTDFDFEPHSFTNYNYPDVQEVQNAAHSYLLEDKNNVGNTTSTNFNLTAKTKIRITNTINRGPNQSLTFDALLPAAIWLYKINGSTVTMLKSWQMVNSMDYRNDFNADGMFQWQEDVVIQPETNAFYSIVVSLPDVLGPQNTSTNSASVASNFNYLNITPEDQQTGYGGGLRVAAIRDYSAEGVLSKKRIFRYITDAGSSGLLMAPLKFLYSQQMYFNKFNGWLQVGGTWTRLYSEQYSLVYKMSSESFVPYSSSAVGNTVGYSRVEEMVVDGQGGANGKTVFQFANLESETKINNPDIPRPLNGYVLQEEIFKSEISTPILKRNYTYSFLNQASFSGVKIFSAYYGSSPCESIGHGYTLPAGRFHEYKQYRIHFYPHNSYWTVLHNMVTKEYTNGGIYELSTNYEYNSKGQQIRSTTLDSKGKTNVNETVFPSDVVSSPGSIEQTIKDQGLYNNVLSQKVLLNGSEVNKIKYTYVNQQGIVLSKAEKSNNGQNFYTGTIFQKYGSNKNIEEYQQNGIHHAVIWSRYNKYPVASIAGAARDKVAFTSFEELEAADWIIPGIPQVNSIPPPTGRRHYNLTDGTITSPALTSGMYRLSYWRLAVDGPLSITGTQTGYPISGATINEWKYFEHVISLSGQLQISGSGLIDEIKIYPVGANMTTFTYEPIVGMTSQCDVNNRITYYEYDGFGRLKLLKDQNGNILKTMDYKYKTN